MAGRTSGNGLLVAAIACVVSVALAAPASARPVRSVTPVQLTWVRMHPPTSPPGELGAPMAYFPPTGQVVLFGDSGPGSPYGVTWLWDGATWTRWSPVGAVPYEVGNTAGL